MKSQINDLAIFGAAPAFQLPLHVGKPNIGDRQRLLKLVNDMFDRRWFANAGPLVEEFEAKLAAYVGVKHCIAMCNDTVALEIAIRATNLSGEVIVPSFAFIATAHALQWQQITPIFCDIDPVTHCLNPDKVSQMITPRTTGIIGVHLWGRSCAIKELTEIADQLNLVLMFDAGHAFGCTYDGEMIGCFGQAEVFSFHATKFFNTFEGGAVVTNDDELAQKMRLMRNFGFSGYDNVIYIGTNGKMSEISAAMGLTAFESLDEFISVNRRNHHAYSIGLKDLPGIRLLEYDESEKCNYQYVIAEVDEDFAGLSRDDLIRVLHAENVLARRYFWPGCHKMEPYKSFFPNAGLLLPASEQVSQRVLVLPTGMGIGTDDIDEIVRILRIALAVNGSVKSHLSKHS
jgi:dTDP-4-amino-4,6-dideoxygalactose transaminase